MNRKDIIVTEDYFNDANDIEICMEWAEDFLNTGRTLDFEIDDIKGTIKNEEMAHLGTIGLGREQWEVEMHEGNLKDYWSYLGWLLNLKKQGVK